MRRPSWTAGTYAATGLATSGTDRPSSARRSSTALIGQAFSRFRYATSPLPSGPVRTCTSSQPSSPHWSRICLVACTMSGTVAYPNFVMSLQPSHRWQDDDMARPVPRDPAQVIDERAASPTRTTPYGSDPAQVYDVRLPPPGSPARSLSVVVVH